jgi:LemA protein
MQTGYPSIDPSLITAAAYILPIFIVLTWIVVTYNRLISLRNLITDSWSNVDTELRRRYDLIPNLVNTVKAYAAHERAVLESVTTARAQAMSSTGDPAAQAHDENQLVRSVRQLLAVSEAYPSLKADQNFLHLQQELVNTEDRIQAARRFFNGNVRDYNILVETFPSNLIASAAGFRRRQFFEIEEAVARAVASVMFQPRA